MSTKYLTPSGFGLLKFLKLAGNVTTINSQSVKVLNRDGSGNVTHAEGTVTITDAGSGYAKGCRYVKTDAVSGVTGEYVNVGTSSSCLFVPVQVPSNFSATATSDGLTTGAIPVGAKHVTVDADSDANNILTLPDAPVGTEITIAENGTTGFELRTSAPATIGINAGTGAGVESAIAGVITLVVCRRVSATNWVCSQFDADGDESKVEQAA